jgi:hypothetical protein
VCVRVRTLQTLLPPTKNNICPVNGTDKSYIDNLKIIFSLCNITFGKFCCLCEFATYFYNFIEKQMLCSNWRYCMSTVNN